MGVSTIDLSAQVRRLGWATLVANIGLVITGGAVRLTASGLGCPTWPRCTEQSFTPHGALDVHSAIEFGNRMLTFVLAAIAILTFVSAWQTRRRELRLLALLLGIGIPAQAVIGGLTVLTDLNPWVVSFHLLCSMAIIGLAVLFLWRLDRPDARPQPATRPVVTLAWLVFLTGWVVLYVGTVVTGSGPHAGDLDVDRNGLDPLQLSQLHADVVFLLIGLSLALALMAPPAARQAALALLVVELAQGAIGFVQYFTDLPIVLVAFHLLGAALVSAAMTWALLATRSAPGAAAGGAAAAPSGKLATTA